MESRNAGALREQVNYVFLPDILLGCPAVFHGVLLGAYKCRFVNDVLHRREREQGLFRRAPVEWSHREVVILTLSFFQLRFEVQE